MPADLIDWRAFCPLSQFLLMLWKWILTLAGLSILGIRLTVDITRNQDPSIAWISAGLLCLLFANLDQIKKLKGVLTGEFELEMRDAVKQAQDTIVELRSLGLLVAKLSLSLVKRAGRWGP